MDTTDGSSPKLFPATFDTVSFVPNARSIAVMMSGGVDSSVTALLLREAGWNIVGITMKIPTGDCSVTAKTCCGAEAAFVCQELGIPHYFVDTEAAFRAQVIAPFKKAYCAGRTPSPCVDCNTFLKFGTVWDLIRTKLGVEHLATGHYARIVKAEEGETVRLGRAKDMNRDQSYFLYGIRREWLPFLHFPLGSRTKTEVRALAGQYGLKVAAKPDSMELCFAGEGDYRRLLTDIPDNPGPICTQAGVQVGCHTGIHNYTVGQRRGMGIAHTEPLYVLQIVPEENTIIVGTKEETRQTVIQATTLNILQPEVLERGAVLRGKVRSVGEPRSCRVTVMEGDMLEVVFDEPVSATAPGQHLVLYDNEDYIVAGGVITGDRR